MHLSSCACSVHQTGPEPTAQLVSIGWNLSSRSRQRYQQTVAERSLGARFSELRFGGIGSVGRVVRAPRRGAAVRPEARRLRAPAVRRWTFDDVRVESHHEARFGRLLDLDRGEAQPRALLALARDARVPRL